ncbi:MAG TPA: hypothetical protein VF456_09560 [Vicinamibacterales bacterium]
MTSRNEPSHTDIERGYEPRDVSVSALAAFGVLLTLILATVLGASHDLAFDLAKWAGHSSSAKVTSVFHPPTPMLEVDPERDLTTFRQREDTQLGSYGWVDRAAGTVHIPIERAMDQMVADGK